MKVGEMRYATLSRDNWECQARNIDPSAGECRDAWGTPFAEFPAIKVLVDLEADYVRLGARGKRHELPEDHVILCPGHHRGTGNQAGYCWATSHRAEMRAWLDAQ